MVRRVYRTLHAVPAVVALAFLERQRMGIVRETRPMSMSMELWGEDPAVVAAGTLRMWPKPSLVGELF